MPATFYGYQHRIFLCATCLKTFTAMRTSCRRGRLLHTKSILTMKRIPFLFFFSVFFSTLITNGVFSSANAIIIYYFFLLVSPRCSPFYLQNRLLFRASQTFGNFWQTFNVLIVAFFFLVEFQEKGDSEDDELTADLCK